jgi:hypothetical protein
MAIGCAILCCYFKAPKLIKCYAAREKQFNDHCMTVRKLSDKTVALGTANQN